MIAKIATKIAIVVFTSLLGTLIGFFVPIFVEPLAVQPAFGRCGYDVIAPYRDFNGMGLNPFLSISICEGFVFGVCGIAVGIALVLSRKYSYIVPILFCAAFLACAVWLGEDIKWLTRPCEENILDDDHFWGAQGALVVAAGPFLYAIILALQALYCARTYRPVITNNLSSYSGSYSITYHPNSTKDGDSGKGRL